MEKERSPELQQKLEKKRFVLSSEEFAKGRIKGVRGSFKELSEQYPELLSVNLYGSMTKGNATPESDVDSIVFVDEEKASEIRGKVDVEELKKKIDEAFREKLTDKFGVAKDFTFNRDFTMTVNFLSRESIDKELDYLAKEFERLEDLKKRDATYKNIDSSWAMWPQGISFACIRLVNMFIGVSIGNGIKRYRAYLLNKLKAMGDVGEQIWKEGVRFIRVHERADVKEKKEDETYDEFSERYKNQYKNLYPQSVDEAIRYYRVAE